MLREVEDGGCFSGLRSAAKRKVVAWRYAVRRPEVKWTKMICDEDDGGTAPSACQKEGGVMELCSSDLQAEEVMDGRCKI
jgi:hypothetical protein